jgi:dolichyl-phosphate mannosyltransferase polypeptide 2 regulatory subunit
MWLCFAHLWVLSFDVYVCVCVCVCVQPFVDTDHFVHNYFPAREYAIIIPGLAGAALISFVLVFVGVVMVKSRHAKPKAKTS